jgi:hypothetical protein
VSFKQNVIHGAMTILDVVSRYRQAEAVFAKYDEKAGVCLCCEALFDPLHQIAERYDLDLEKLLADLNTVANNDSG